ncbi:sacsin N-terminal ATP-binding-like domain-containing protein [Cellulosimicrobium sp. CpK407]|uniref:sacsin N-terminal ATP-binding-like domain-containing protein n=1 Tax=Cellulosimicrobium sp. CpK407 TaxID=3229847 RepID=UPI003F3AA952
MRERQRITITNYTNDPALLEEHVGMEDNFQAGGYGERQVEELLQNALDQLVEPGRVELRLSDGALYCANEGNPFGAAGIRAVTGAFLSSKRDEKIGRFGLGFKSVLGVTDHPQILSRSISFGFNEPGAVELLSALPYHPARVPALRVPSTIDPHAIAAEDPNVAELMTWATTVIRLPLVRGGGRLRQRLLNFDARYLLFPENLSGVTITVGSGADRIRSEFHRAIDPTTGLVELEEKRFWRVQNSGFAQLETPEQSATSYRVLHREHDVSDEVKADLPGLFHREHVRVSYALPVGQGRRGDGEFWAWFPLQDRTTAQGIFNAPWQVNDDRTSMLASSALNRELLDVAADLLIDAAVLESTPEDPAKHFDVLPARGRETRSNADKYMSERIPRLARMHQLIPTLNGEMRSPARVRAPYYYASKERSYAFPAQAIRSWSEATGAVDTPHWSCYQNATRAARLTQLLTDENGRLSATPIAPVEWLTEAAKPRTLASVGAALDILTIIARDKGDDVVDQFRWAKVIPLADGTFEAAKDAAKVLLPLDDAPTPTGVALVDDEFSRDLLTRRKLRSLGVQEVSADQVAAAVAASITSASSDDDWAHLWGVLALASVASGTAALQGITNRGLAVRVPTKAGGWRPATEVFRDSALVPKLPRWQADIVAVGGRSDLLQVAGCLGGLTDRWPVHTGEVFAEYRRAMERQAERAISEQYGRTSTPNLRFEVREGPGPIDVLKSLADLGDPAADDARAKLTGQLIRLTVSPRISASIDFRGGERSKKGEFKSVERWGVEKYGLVHTSQGPKPLRATLGRQLADFSDYLPVATESFAGQYALPGRIEDVRVPALEEFMTRTGYRPAHPELLGEVLAVAAREDTFADPDMLPALDIATHQVELTPLNRVVVAEDDELGDLAVHGLRYIPSGPWNDALRKVWGVLGVADVVARVVDWATSGKQVPLLDIYPSLARIVSSPAAVDEVFVARCSSIVRRTTSPTGVKEQRLSGHLDGRVALVDDELSDVDTLLQVSQLLGLRLARSDAERVIQNDEKLRTNKLVQRTQAAQPESAKLLTLVGRDVLASNLPQGLLSVIEERQGKQADEDVAELFLTTYGNDSLRRLRAAIVETGLPVPRRWDGTSEAEHFVTRFGFPRAFAGARDKKAPAVDIVPGKVELKGLHDFQEDLLQQIRDLTLTKEADGNCKRGLLYLPTGAGKTRVTTQAIATMLRDDELSSPVLWIAQSEELCEQAIVSWTEVWRAVGDERALEITRYWGDYEADESFQELQVAIATDAKLAQMIASDANRQAHRWLRDSRLVVIDEAHRAGSQRYTQILEWLGISQRGGTRTERPLLGLTATPYRGTNADANRLFAQRFGSRLLNALDEEDPIGQLREMQVLSRVEHQLLDSNIVISDPPAEGRGGSAAWDDVSRAILDRLGANLDRTQLLVDHVLRQDTDWPILVFTPSVVSAHVTAALIRSLGRTAEAVDGEMRGQERRRKIEGFKSGETKVLVNCDLLTQGFDAPKVRALYIARPTFSPNRYVQMVGRGLRGPRNGGTEDCLVVNVRDTFEQFDKDLAYTEFAFLWDTTGV